MHLKYQRNDHRGIHGELSVGTDDKCRDVASAPIFSSSAVNPPPWRFDERSVLSLLLLRRVLPLNVSANTHTTSSEFTARFLHRLFHHCPWCPIPFRLWSFASRRRLSAAPASLVHYPLGCAWATPVRGPLKEFWSELSGCFLELFLGLSQR